MLSKNTILIEIFRCDIYFSTKVLHMQTKYFLYILLILYIYIFILYEERLINFIYHYNYVVFFL